MYRKVAFWAIAAPRSVARGRNLLQSIVTEDVDDRTITKKLEFGVNSYSIDHSSQPRLYTWSSAPFL